MNKIIHKTAGASPVARSAVIRDGDRAPFLGQMSFDFWYESVDEREPTSSAESVDPRSQETSRERKVV
jgi:hypothetical protein